MKTLVITKDIGGQALLTNDIQNYPGFMQIGGFELMTKFQEQAATYGAGFAYDEVISVVDQGEEKIVSTRNDKFSATAIILAFGKTPRDLGVKGEDEFRGRGVSYCAVCDGPVFKGRVVSVAGAGDHALQAAVYLSGVASKVNLILPSKELRGDEDLVRSVKENPEINTILGSKVTSINGSRVVESINVDTQNSSGNGQIQTAAVFVEMGYVAKTDLVKDLVDLNKDREVIVDRYCSTSQEGIFACGDVTDVPYKQAVISAGQGSIAALSAYNYVQKLRGKPTSRTDWKNVRPEPS